MIVKMIKEFGRKTDTQSNKPDPFKKQLENNKKNNQKEVKNTITEMKNSLKGINSRLNEVELSINELNDKVWKSLPPNRKKEKGSLRDLLQHQGH